MRAAQASLQAMYPARLVERGLQDPAQLGDVNLAQGVYTLIATGTRDWADYRGREGQDGTLGFVIVGYSRVDDSATPEQLEENEEAMEDELMAWCQAIKPAPLDSVYPKDIVYSRGFDFPYTWVVLGVEALHI